MSKFMLRDGGGRPIFDEPLRAYGRALCAANSESLGHVDVARVLFVAGAARRAARATIRPLTLGGRPPSFARDGWAKPQVWLRGRLALYEICLRPRYFLDSTPDERAQVIAHELWHIAPAFDGSLAADRRHRHAAAAEGDRVAAGWVDRWRRRDSPGQAVLTYRGELRLSAWTERPPARLGPTGRRRYSADDLHLAIIEQR